MFLLVAHFDAAPGQPSAADAALELLAVQPDCRWLRYAQSPDEAGRSVLVAEFESAAGYRRALAPFDVRTTVVPWLSTARVDDSGVSEVVLTATDGVIRRYPPTVPEPGR